MGDIDMILRYIATALDVITIFLLLYSQTQEEEKKVAFSYFVCYMIFVENIIALWS